LENEAREKKKINKGNMLIIVTIVVLTIIVVITAVLNRENIEERMELQESGGFLVTMAERTYVVSMKILMGLEPMEVSASPRGQLRNFTGVPLVAILDYFYIDYSEVGTVVFTSLDGFAAAISIEEATDETNTFIVFKESGQALGTREEGGLGPYMVVVALDQFPNRWARYLMEVTLL